jgi:GMP synthase-like glutamine amidotransferase
VSGDSFEVVAEHRCAITLPSGFLHLGSSKACYNSIMRLADPAKNIVSFQCHLERPVEGAEINMGQLIYSNFIDTAERHAFALE